MDIVAYVKELEEDNDRLQRLYQDEHYDNLRYKELLNKIKKLIEMELENE